MKARGWDMLTERGVGNGGVSKGLPTGGGVPGCSGVRRFGAAGTDVGWVTCTQQPCDLMRP